MSAHRWMALSALAASVVGGATATEATAQDASAGVGYVALLSTPQGALPPLPTQALSAPHGGNVVLRYGHLTGTHHIGIGGNFPAHAGRLGVTFGYITCSGCDGIIMAGVDFDAPLARTSLEHAGSPSGTELIVSLAPAVGVARSAGSGHGTILSGSLSLPVALALPLRPGPRAPRLVPFLSPGFGVGYITGNGDSETGTRLMVGGGVAFADLAPGFGLLASAQKILIEGGRTQFGFGLWFGARS